MKINRVIHTTFILTLVFSLTSCSSILMGLYGIKKPRVVEETEILKYSTKYKIPAADSYALDTSYVSYLHSLDTVKFKSQIKNHLQPLQALYYDNKGHVQVFLANCYAGGFPNLKWNRNGTLDTFPPKQQAPIDSIAPLNTQFKYLNRLAASAPLTSENCDYLVIVYWSRFMGRQSKRFIQSVQNNCKKATDKKVKLIFANTDNVFAKWKH